MAEGIFSVQSIGGHPSRRLTKQGGDGWYATQYLFNEVLQDFGDVIRKRIIVRHVDLRGTIRLARRDTPNV